MNDALPNPLTPSDCDLRPFRDMPFEIGRFQSSHLVSHESPEAIVAAIFLWCAAWHQVPAASLPNDDRVLCLLAGYGRVLESWMKVRAGALRGFVLCSDGRLYHETVAEKANNSWMKRLEYEWGKAKDRHRKRETDISAGERTAFPTFEIWNEQRRAGSQFSSLAESNPAIEAGQPEEAFMAGDRALGLSSGSKGTFQRNDIAFPPENSLKERKDKEKKGTHPNRGTARKRTCGESIARIAEDHLSDDRGGLGADYSLKLTEAVCEAARYPVRTEAEFARAVKVVRAWEAEGIDFDEVVIPTLRRISWSQPELTRSLGRFRQDVRRAQRRFLAGKPIDPTKDSRPVFELRG